MLALSTKKLIDSSQRDKFAFQQVFWKDYQKNIRVEEKPSSLSIKRAEISNTNLR